MATTISGQTFANSDVVAGQKFYAANYLALIAQMQALNDELVSECVSLGGTQTISGVKTFSAFPLTPSSAPTANYQTANKKYVDDQIDATVGSGTMSPLSYSGGESVTLPNGLIIKMGHESSDGEVTITFGTAFPNNIITALIVGVDASGTTGNYNTAIRTYTKTAITAYVNTTGDSANWIAIGY